MKIAPLLNRPFRHGLDLLGTAFRTHIARQLQLTDLQRQLAKQHSSITPHQHQPTVNPKGSTPLSYAYVCAYVTDSARFSGSNGLVLECWLLRRLCVAEAGMEPGTDRDARDAPAARERADAAGTVSRGKK